jgi:hypothetical protein
MSFFNITYDDYSIDTFYGAVLDDSYYVSSLRSDGGNLAQYTVIRMFYCLLNNLFMQDLFDDR